LPNAFRLALRALMADVQSFRDRKGKPEFRLIQGECGQCQQTHISRRP
jgi:hypothetical protein